MPASQIKTDRRKVLIVFNAGANVYGMERAVIEIFDLLRPEVEPHFLMSDTSRRRGLPILREIEERRLPHSFFSDRTEWPRVGKPRSLGAAWGMASGVVRGNRDVLSKVWENDFIYVPGISYFYFACLALLVHRLRGKRSIYHFHDLISSPSSALRRMSRFLTDYVHNTAFGYERVNETNACLQSKQQHVIPLMVRPSLSTACACARTDSPGRINITYVGQVASHKGIDILLDAFDQLVKSRQDLVLNIVGGCAEPVLSSRLERAMLDTDAIKWWGYQEDVSPFLRTADIYVQPSPPSRFEESFCLGVVEAMSVGTPVVCFRSGALAEVMVHEETGLICDDESPQALAGSIERLLKDTELRDYCGRQAAKHFKETYSATAIKSRWLSVLEIA